MIIQTLLEQSEPTPADLDDISHILKAECSEFLSNPTPLFRGVKNDLPLVMKAKIRTDRRSLSGRNVGTVLYNEIIKEAFNVSDVRNRCHFITNNVREAYMYGDPYMVFPVNGARVLFNPGVADSINVVGDIWYMITDKLRPYMQPGDIDLIQQAIQQLDVPGASIDVLYHLFDNLSSGAAERMEQDWNRVKHKLADGYGISAVSSIPKYDSAVEYMLFDAPHTYLIHLDTAAKLLGTYDHGSSVDTYTEMLANIKSL